MYTWIVGCAMGMASTWVAGCGTSDRAWTQLIHHNGVSEVLITVKAMSVGDVSVAQLNRMVTVLRQGRGIEPEEQRDSRGSPEEKKCYNANLTVQKKI